MARNADDIRYSVELAGIRDDAEFDAYCKLHNDERWRAEKSSRWKVLRKFRAMRLDAERI